MQNLGTSGHVDITATHFGSFFFARNRWGQKNFRFDGLGDNVGVDVGDGANVAVTRTRDASKRSCRVESEAEGSFGAEPARPVFEPWTLCDLSRPSAPPSREPTGRGRFGGLSSWTPRAPGLGTPEVKAGVTQARTWLMGLD